MKPDHRALKVPFDVSNLEQKVRGRGRTSLSAARTALDAITAGGAALAALGLRFGLNLLEVKETSPVTLPAHVFASGIWVLAVSVALASNRLYDEDTLFPGGGESARLVRSVIEAAAAMSLFVFFTQSFYVSRSWFALSLLLTLLGLMAQRQAVRSYLQRQRRSGRFKRPSFLVSSEGGVWSEWYDVRNEEFEVIAELDADGVETVATAVLSNASLKRDLSGSALVLRARDFNRDEFWQLVLRAGQLGWSVFVHSPVRSVGRDRLSVRDVAGHTIVKVGPPSLRGWRGAQKRALDVVLSLVALIFLAPILIAIGVAIAVTSGRPILYKQTRVGLGGRTFDMWKFRTMTVDAEAASGPMWTVENDARRTRLGVPLRRTSLDELPQLWNVLKGDMSLIGPRPERPVFVDEFSSSYPWYEFRHRIRPGITGWAQSQGLRGNTELDMRLESDNWYIENWSIWLDLKILGGTITELIRGRNAY